MGMGAVVRVVYSQLNGSPDVAAIDYQGATEGDPKVDAFGALWVREAFGARFGDGSQATLRVPKGIAAEITLTAGQAFDFTAQTDPNGKPLGPIVNAVVLAVTTPGTILFHGPRTDGATKDGTTARTWTVAGVGDGMDGALIFETIAGGTAAVTLRVLW